jgi:hypothetical protein
MMQHYSDSLRRRQIRDRRGNGVDREVAFDVSGRFLSGGGGHVTQ